MNMKLPHAHNPRIVRLQLATQHRDQTAAYTARALPNRSRCSPLQKKHVQRTNSKHAYGAGELHALIRIDERSRSHSTLFECMRAECT